MHACQLAGNQMQVRNSMLRHVYVLSDDQYRYVSTVSMHPSHELHATVSSSRNFLCRPLTAAWGVRRPVSHPQETRKRSWRRMIAPADVSDPAPDLNGVSTFFLVFPLFSAAPQLQAGSCQLICSRCPKWHIVSTLCAIHVVINNKNAQFDGGRGLCSWNQVLQLQAWATMLLAGQSKSVHPSANQLAKI